MQQYFFYHIKNPELLLVQGFLFCDLSETNFKL